VKIPWKRTGLRLHCMRNQYNALSLSLIIFIRCTQTLTFETLKKSVKIQQNSTPLSCVFLTYSKWKIPTTFLVNSSMAANIENMTLSVISLLDQHVWIHSPDQKHAFDFFHSHLISLDWASIILCSCIPSSYSFIYWSLTRWKLPTE
jgi:hypothetical protein